MGSTRAAATGSKDDNILLVGATGGTGGSVLDGLLASGISSASLHVLSRNPTGKGAQALATRGVHVVTGDLDDEASVREAMKGMRAVYCHATSKDAAKADPIGDIRAEKLARAAKDAGIEHIVYNSSGGRGANTKISQVDQKHHIEDIFVESGIPTTNLQAVLFMEEFWKVTTRPAIQKGTFPFSMPADKPLQLLAVKDMGRAAGTALLKPEEYAGKSLELAGDELTPRQLCEEFSLAQGGSPVKQLSLPRFLFWFLNKDLFRIIKFLAETGYSAEIDDCRARFPGMLTFREFLKLTDWGNSKRTYEGGFRY
ncbi:hypothetical protein KFL_002360070 [Klebsormidium nitens]|uniref:NmrA-like domain-containing protein n=1 Tax=Klebsormidium nitens TaxID=105231 RepID=A0A0U9HKE3_KLENI|nr:hypothetical protein KFL_002360070 [Klebsormidium nitens]|eukprot:GAQ85455.1 hypothetical protein KFL_002360070 [Klebsormidium nitens]